MKNVIIVLFTCLLMSASCKPDPADLPEDLIIQLMTNGEWSVIDFKLNGVDKTPDFAAYRFKYYSDKTVNARYDTSTFPGTWDGSTSTMTTSNNFPTAIYPITLVNGTWRVDSPGTRIVKTSQISGSDVKTMKLYRE